MATLTRGTVSVTRLDTGETRVLEVDTSFEPYRREAFRRRTIEAQRESINLTNIAGEGTLATEGTWRREQVEWSYGAGQFSLDRKGDDNERRFLYSEGIDIFNYPERATLLPAVNNVLFDWPGGSETLLTFCNNVWCVADQSGGVVYIYNPSTPGGTAWSRGGTCSYDGTGATPSAIYSMCSNSTVVYIATDTGIWYATPATGGGVVFTCYAANDSFGVGYAYNLVRWANDQLIAAAGPRLYAFQPRGGAGEAPFATPPSSINPNFTGATITDIVNGYPSGAGTSASITTNAPHGLVTGQYITLSGTIGRAYATATPTLSGSTLTVTTSYNHGFVVGQQVLMTHTFTNGAVRTETCPIVSVPSATSFTYQTTKVGTPILAVGYVGGTFVATGDVTGYGYNTSFTVSSVISTTEFEVTGNSSQYGALSLGGAVTDPSANGTYQPDALVTVQDPSWVWSDATGGQTQVYFGGYSAPPNGPPKNGGIYRSDLLGSSTSSSDGIQTIASASVAQPWMLDVPVQCLPMSPDEYPVCVRAYLNYIFVGTNRGLRMCQTLSVYDPTATATGDLKSGSIIPNLLHPVQYPVYGIAGDGRFVWFSWGNKSGSFSGAGKLDLTTFLPGDDLTPVYATDIGFDGTEPISDMVWDPINNLPLIVCEDTVWCPYANNEYGQIVATQTVTSGFIQSSYFDFGIAEPKIPIFFDYGAWLPTDTQVAASVILDPLAVSPTTISVDPYTAADSLNDNEYTIVDPGAYPNDRGRLFQVVLTLSTTSPTNPPPVLNRWTLKAWATPVQGTLVSAVINAFRVTTTAEGTQEGSIDPEDNWNWLEDIRWNGILVTYTDGQSSVLGVIDSIDDIPHKARGDYKGGFEGDFVVDVKTLAQWTFTPATTD